MSFKTTINLLKKLNNNEEISEDEQKVLNDLYLDNVLFNDYIQLSKKKKSQTLNTDNFIETFNSRWVDFANLIKGSKQPNENTSEFIEELSELYSYDKKIDQTQIDDLDKFYIERGDWEDWFGSSAVKNTYFLKHEDHGYIDTFKAILKDESAGDSIGNLKFSIGWKPEYYEKIDEILSEDLKKTLFEKMNDITYFPQPEYQSLVNENRQLFNKSILRYSSTSYKVNEIYNNNYNNIKRLSLKTSNFEDNVLEINFDDVQNLNNRFIILIGQNGVGKSKLLKDIYTENNEFDFDYEVLGSQINCRKQLYFSFGLFDEISNLPKKESYHIKSFLNEFEFNELLDKGLLRYSKARQQKLTSYIEMFFGNTNVRLNDFQDTLENFYLGRVNYNDLFVEFLNLSTGEKYITYFLICIMSNITTDSIVYIDEPENSQHPQYVMKIMSVLDSILKDYDSKAIVATHSHLIIQGIPRYAVIHMYVDENGNNKISKLDIETFGRNFNALMHQIYNIHPSEYLYIKKIDELLAEDNSIDLSQLYEGNDFDGSILESYIYSKQGDEID